MTPTRMSLAVGFTVGGSIEKSQNEKTARDLIGRVE